MTEPSTPPYRPLGAFRFLLATLVLTSHASVLLPGGEALVALSLGNVGVMTFFVLSGFVIAEALDRFYRRRITAFGINRALKIMPAYWAALVVTLAVWAIVGHPHLPYLDPQTLVGNLILMGGYLGLNATTVISIAWAVQIEVIFYALMAGTVWLTWRRASPAWAAAVWSLAAAAAAGLYLFVTGTGAEARFYGVFQFAPHFGLGVAWHAIVTRGPGAGRAPALALFAVLSLHAYTGYVGRNPDAALWVSTLLFGSAVAAFCALAPRTVPDRWRRLDVMLGDATYALYLSHMAVLVLLERIFGGPGYAAFALAFPAAFALASVLHQIAEAPIFVLRDRMRGRPLYR